MLEAGGTPALPDISSEASRKLALAGSSEADSGYSGPKGHDYVIFDSYPLTGAYLYSKTESTGNSWVDNLSGKLPIRSEPAYTPGSSIELTFVSSPGGSWKARLIRHLLRGLDDWDNGVFIQTKPTPYKTPSFLQFRLLAANTKPSEMPKVALFLKGDKSISSIDIGRFLSPPDNNSWMLARIPLTEFKDSPITASEQVQGIVFEQGSADGVEHKLFIDQVELRAALEPKFSKDVKPTLIEAKGYERHVDLKWDKITDEGVIGTIIERSTDGVNFIPVGYKPRNMSRFADFVGERFGNYKYRICFLANDGSRSNYSAVQSGTTRAFNDNELLDMVQEACARYYWDGGEEFSGMTLESIPGDPHMIATGASGFGIMSLVVAADRSFIPRKDVAQRIQKILTFLEKEDRFHGAMAHYYNGKTAHPILFFGPDDNGGDLVETSFLMQGLLTARQFFDGDSSEEKNIRERITKLWQDVEWNWYRSPADSPYLVWHWSPTVDYKINHKLIGWNESMITYLLAIASPGHPVPPELYYSGWASQEKSAQEYRGNAAGKMYSNGETFYGQKLDVGGFTGGPIFFIHYNFMGMDPHGLKDKYTEYFDNSKSIARINLRYCQANPAHHHGYGDDGWGLSASDGPFGYNPDEPRADGDKGKLTPTGALASMPYLPPEAMAALKNYYRNQGSFLWGEYGFRDAYSLDEHWVNDLYMGLNQGPMVVMIENYRTGRPWKLFGSNPEIGAMRTKVFKQ